MQFLMPLRYLVYIFVFLLSVTLQSWFSSKVSL